MSRQMLGLGFPKTPGTLDLLVQTSDSQDLMSLLSFLFCQILQNIVSSRLYNCCRVEIKCVYYGGNEFTKPDCGAICNMLRRAQIGQKLNTAPQKRKRSVCAKQVRRNLPGSDQQLSCNVEGCMFLFKPVIQASN